MRVAVSDNMWVSVKDKRPREETDVLVLVREIEYFGKHIRLTENAYGGSVIRKLKERYDDDD